MIDLSDYIVAGIISRVHGVHGQIVLQLNNLSFDNILKLESVFIEFDGLPVPFFIDHFAGKNSTAIILSVENIDTEKKARDFIDKVVYINSNCVKTDDLEEQQTNVLLGYTVIDQVHGKIGILNEILEFQVNPLLKVKNGKKEILIPLQDEFILKVDKKAKIIFVKTPPGLTELFD